MAMRQVLTGALVIVASLVLGGLTSPAQGWLPDALRPFANSASGWTLLTALVVWAARQQWLTSAVLGLLSFVGLLVGYQVVSALRGHPDSETLFLAAAIVVGPVVGIAAAWLRRRDLRSAIGGGVLAGIGLGDAANGLLRVLIWTGSTYWIAIGVVAVALVAVVAVRARTARVRIVAIGLPVVVGGVYFAVFGVL